MLSRALLEIVNLDQPDTHPATLRGVKGIEEFIAEVSKEIKERVPNP